MWGAFTEMIFLTLGSQKFQFDRLIKMVDELAEKGVIQDEIVAQTGFSKYEPVHFKTEPFMDALRFNECVNRADVIISHAGTSTIIKAVKAGKKVIVVPRLAKYGEHVDDHQTQITEMFCDLNIVMACNDGESLEEKLEEIKTKEFQKYVSNTENVIRAVDQCIAGFFGGNENAAQ